MKDLNAREVVEMENYAIDFVRDRALDGMACVVIMVGRGHSYVGYAEELSDEVPRLLERAYLTARKHNARKQN